MDDADRNGLKGFAMRTSRSLLVNSLVGISSHEDAAHGDMDHGG
jgi:hypothetical protein